MVGPFQIYQRVSSAKVNLSNSGGLLCGVWKELEVPQLLRGLKWSREGLEVFGMYLGLEGWVSRNWDGTFLTINHLLAKVWFSRRFHTKVG